MAKLRENWIKNHLTPGTYICLEDLFPKERRFICKVLSFICPKRRPVWLRLKLLSPGEYPNPPGAIVDYVERHKGRVYLHCSFRNVQVVMKHLFLLQPILHFPKCDLGGLFDTAKEASSLMVKECSILTWCPAGKKCTDRTLLHLIRYYH